MLRTLWLVVAYNLFNNMRPKAEWAINSEAMRAKRNNCFSKIQLVGKKYPDKTTLSS